MLLQVSESHVFPITLTILPSWKSTLEQMDTLGSPGEQSEISSALQCLPWAPCTQVRTTAQLSNNQTAANKTDEFSVNNPPSYSSLYWKKGTEMDIKKKPP